MAARIQTEFGNILIDNEVIARVAGLAAIECYGVVGMASINVKDGIVQLLLGDSLAKGDSRRGGSGRRRDAGVSYHRRVWYQDFCDCG